MIHRKYRFHGHGGLRYLYKNGQTARNRSVMIRSIENPTRPRSRYVVIIAKKIVKSAVGRNRIRRRVYEVLRRHMSELTPHHDIAVTVFAADFMTISGAELERSVLEVLSQAHLYRPKQ